MTSIAASVLGTFYITEQSTKLICVPSQAKFPTPPWIGGKMAEQWLQEKEGRAAEAKDAPA